MQIDISPELQKAFEKKEAWSCDRARRLIFHIHEQLNTTSQKSGRIELDWDELSGESWAVFLANNTLALVCVVAPILFVKSDYVLNFEQICEDYDVVIIGVEDFDDKKFIAVSGVLDNIFGFEVSGVSPEAGAFSANDLWFNTV